MRTTALSLLAFLSLTACAHAGEADAKRLFTDGESAFATGRFLEAAHDFEEAWAESRRLPLLWNIAQAYRRQFALDGDPAHLERACVVLAHYGELADASLIGEAKESLRACERERAALAAVPEKAGAPGEGSQRNAGIGLLGAGGGLGLMGLGFGLGARSEASTVEHTGSVAMPAPFARVANHESNGQLYQTLSYVSYGVGAAAALAGVVIEIVHVRRRAAPLSSSVRNWTSGSF